MSHHTDIFEQQHGLALSGVGQGLGEDFGYGPRALNGIGPVEVPAVHRFQQALFLKRNLKFQNASLFLNYQSHVNLVTYPLDQGSLARPRWPREQHPPGRPSTAEEPPQLPLLRRDAAESRPSAAPNGRSEAPRAHHGLDIDGAVVGNSEH